MAQPQNTLKIDKDRMKMITAEFRASHAHVWKPNGMPGTSPETWKYTLEMLFDKSKDMTGTTVPRAGKPPVPRKLTEIIHAAKLARFGAVFGKDPNNWPKCNLPVMDGDTPKYAGKPEYKGMRIVRAKAGLDYQPGIVGMDLKPITNPADFQSGDYARAEIFCSIREFPVNSGKFWVNFSLDNILKTREGQKFGGRNKASDSFSAFATGADTGEAEEFDDEASTESQEDEVQDF